MAIGTKGEISGRRELFLEAAASSILLKGKGRKLGQGIQSIYRGKDLRKVKEREKITGVKNKPISCFGSPPFLEGTKK